MKLNTYYYSEKHMDAHAVMNWRENSLGDSLYYSFRATRYNRQNYPSSLHYHDYYELVVILGGDIHYLCEGKILVPRRGDVVLIPPGKLHLSAPDADETLYERHVFYLYPDAFGDGDGGALAAFVTAYDRMMCAHAPAEALALLPRLDAALEKEQPRERALAMALAMQFFYALGSERFTAGHPGALPEQVENIQCWLDENLSSVHSVSEVAAHFFYSREYVSRLWKKHFNTTVSSYLLQRRVALSQQLLAQGASLDEACFQAGFSSIGTFIRAFKRITGLPPSAWRGAQKNRI